MNLERTKPETLAAGVMDYMPQSLAAHEYAERLNTALARLGLTERLTLPPAPNTAIDELPAVVDVPLRKTLSVLMGKAQQGDASALATLEMTAQVAESIFAGLHARASVYPLALPSHESLATLSQGVDALLPRKISTGWSVASLLADPTCDGIDDGVSLVRLFCTDAIDSVTELKDDNEGWVMTKAFAAKKYFPNSSKVQLGCGEIRVPFEHAGGTVFDSDEEYQFTAIKKITPSTAGGFGHGIFNGDVQSHDIDLGDLEEIETGGFFGLIKCSGSTTDHRYALIARKLRKCPALFARYNDSQIGITKVVVGKIDTRFQPYYIYGSAVRTPNLIHFEFGEGTSASLDLRHWIPTTALSERLPIFLSNFKTYIAERLKGGYAVGTGPTLTLSQAVRDAIEGDPTIAQIITSKGWTISPAPSV